MEKLVTEQTSNNRSSTRSSSVAAKSKISAIFNKNSLPQTDGAITEPNSLSASPDSDSKQVKQQPRHSSTQYDILDDSTATDHSENSSLDWDYSDNNMIDDPDHIFQTIDLNTSFMNPSLNLDLTTVTVQPNRVYNLEPMLQRLQHSPAQPQKKGDADQ